MNRNNFLSGLLRTTLAAGALAISASPVFADDDEKGEKKEKKGNAAPKRRTVTTGVASGVSNTALTVTPTGGAAITYVLNAETDYHLTGVIGLANGQTVRVTSRKDTAGANVARQVRVPAKA